MTLSVRAVCQIIDLFLRVKKWHLGATKADYRDTVLMVVWHSPQCNGGDHYDLNQGVWRDMEIWSKMMCPNSAKESKRDSNNSRRLLQNHRGAQQAARACKCKCHYKGRSCDHAKRKMAFEGISGKSINVP